MISLNVAGGADLVKLALEIVRGCRAFGSHEEVSQYVARSLYQNLGTPGEPECALVRIYRLTPVTHLPSELQALVEEDERYVMALTGTYGAIENWCDRRKSANHKVIPIKKVAVQGLIPMFENILINGMRVDIDRLYATGDVIASTAGIAGTLYVPDVAQSPQHVPAQKEFVIPYGIKSQIGFGGVMAGGGESISLYTLFIFTHVPVREDAAQAFFEMRPILGTALATRHGQTIFAG